MLPLMVGHGEQNKRSISKMNLKSELTRLNVVEQFKAFCLTHTLTADLQRWCATAGVHRDAIPKTFTDIRRKFGVSARPGGKRDVAGRKPGAVRVRGGNFNTPH